MGRLRNFDLDNMIGKKFNKLTILKLDHHKNGKYYWFCECECGNNKVVAQGDLHNGKTRSCGCLWKAGNKCGNFIDLTGRRFYEFIVVEFSHYKDKRYYWKCLCSCGTKKIIEGGRLREGRIQSCGCLNYEKKLQSYGKATFNLVWLGYIHNAKKRNLNFDITKEEFKKLIKQNCYYCGKEPCQIVKSDSNNGDCIYNGLDRIDSSKGYFVDNVVPCCGRCNEAKMNVPQDEFIGWIKQVYTHLFVN